MLAGAEVNILIIEDNQESASILENSIKDLGYKVWTFLEPRDALEMLKNTPIAAVITEVRSARMNGAEVARQVRKVSPDTNVVVITFYSFINSAIEAMEAGAYGYITKPFNSSEIRIVLEHAVERFFLLSSGKEKDYYAQLAVIDGLTGLYNRRFFKESMTIEFARIKRHSSKLSLLMIDIDNFKNYNDTNGHPAGDEALRKTAKLLKGSLREMDIVCRYGGEEFIVMLSQTDKGGAQLVAERLRVQANLYLPFTLSLGVATYPEDSQDINNLVEKADAALYKAKQGGKNRWVAAS